MTGAKLTTGWFDSAGSSSAGSTCCAETAPTCPPAACTSGLRGDTDKLPRGKDFARIRSRGTSIGDVLGRGRMCGRGKFIERPP